MSSTFKLLVNGVSKEGQERESSPVLNPATGQSIGESARATRVDIQEAIEATSAGFHTWKKVPAWERGRILKHAASLMRANCQRIAGILTTEQGKPLSESVEELERAADFIEWGGEQARRISGRIIPGREAKTSTIVEYHPIGVVAAFSPWNFPLALAAKKFAGALGAGCAIICKPPQETPGAVLEMAKILIEAGVHPAAIAVLYGDAGMISAQLIAAPEIKKLTFTGSIPVGKQLASAAGAVMKPVTMELGGHAPVIVCGDVNPEAVAEQLVHMKFKNAGQICLCPSRFYVEESIVERFTQRFVELVKRLKVGSGLDSESDMGPLITDRRVQAMERLVDDALLKGATLLTGGKRLSEQGFFYAPTVMINVSKDAEILHEEPFGPVVPILPFNDETQMLQEANGLPFGLASYIFTGDAVRRERILDALEYGAVSINGPLTHLPEAALGGWKESGIGTEGGIEILDPYLISKHISIH